MYVCSTSMQCYFARITRKILFNFLIPSVTRSDLFINFVSLLNTRTASHGFSMNLLLVISQLMLIAITCAVHLLLRPCEFT